MFEDFLKRMTKGFGATWSNDVFNNAASCNAGGWLIMLYYFRHVRIQQLRFTLIMRFCGYRRGNICLQLE